MAGAPPGGSDNVITDFDPFADMARLATGSSIRAIVDGGAYIGSISCRLADAFPDATVYAFEPQRESFQQLEELSRSRAGIQALPQALGSTSGEGYLQIGVLPYTSSVLKRPGSGTRYYPSGADLVDERQVEIVALDDWAQSRGLEQVDIIKLDVQGFELQTLIGAKRLLRRGVKFVYAEVSFVPLYESTCLFHDLVSYLQDFSLSLYRLYDLHYADNGQLVYGDALFLSESIRERALL